MTLVARHGFYPPSEKLPRSRESALARTGICIGNFDGVHAGHQHLFQAARTQVGALGRVIAMSFYPNPAVVLRKSHEATPLQTFRLQLASMESCRVDELHLVHFTERFSRLTAEEFLCSYVLPFHPEILVMGSDARIGYGGSGDATFIETFGRSHAFKVEITPFFEKDGSKVSSRRIRGLIQSGEVREAASLLTRPYALGGRTQRGEQRGRTIGFPTLNLHSVRQTIPGHGVYATLTRIDGRLLPSVTNVGIRPTLGGQEVRVETHLIGTSIELGYGKRVEVLFIERLRPERRFGSMDELKAAISQDVEHARRIHETSQEGLR